MDPAAVRVCGVDIRTWLVAPGVREGRGRLVVLVGVLAFVTSCSLLPGPRPDPSPTGPPVSPSTRPAVPPPTEFAPLPADATKGLSTGANDFDTGLAASGSTVVTSSIVYGNRLAPAFRISIDAGATWQLGGLSEAGEAATPPDQGDQPTDIAVSTVDGTLRWVALGSSWRQPLTWTSDDGRRWDRHVPPADQIGRDDGPVELAAVPEGFVLVGTDAGERPTAWTSPDGVTWKPHRLPGKGSPAAVTSKGSTVVVVGSSGDTYATWSSQDRGRTWTRGTKPPKPADDGDFSRSLDDVTATEDGFTAIGSYSADDWRPVLYRSKTGSSWQETPAPPHTKEGTGGTRVRAAEGVEVAGTQDYADQGRPRLWFRHGDGWREAKTPLRDGSRLEEGEWSLGDLTRSGDAWIAVAQLSRNGQVVSELWRSDDGGRTYTEVERPEAELNEPVALPLAVVRNGDETLVLGDSRRRPVAWIRPGGTEDFGPAQLISARATDRVGGGSAGPKGVLAYGNRTTDGTETAVVWRRDGNRWSATRDGTFSKAGRRYASSSIAQVAWLRNRWYAVGETSDNGDLNSSALVASSPDGRTWTKGRPERTYERAGGDVWYDVTDLQGDHDRTRAMSGIAAVGSGLLVVGDSAEGDEVSGKGTTATVWTSDDGRTWTMRRLPLGGLHWSSMEHVAVRGSTVVVIGTGAVGEAGPSRPVIWHSTDGGESFRQQVLDQEIEAEDAVTTVSALRSGFAVTAERIAGTSRPVVLLSADGATWRDLPLTVGVRGPDEGAVIGDAAGVGDDLWLLVRTTNRAGAGTRLLVQPTG